MHEENKKKEIVNKLKEIGLTCGYDYDFAHHPEFCLWTAYHEVAMKIAKIMGKWHGYNIDFAGGYYYWNC
ncbi:MAG: hypothetical protein QXE06_06955 [Candidatus Bathyarchaeia archaeon]